MNGTYVLTRDPVALANYEPGTQYTYHGSNDNGDFVIALYFGENPTGEYNAGDSTGLLWSGSRGHNIRAVLRIRGGSGWFFDNYDYSIASMDCLGDSTPLLDAEFTYPVCEGGWGWGTHDEISWTSGTCEIVAEFRGTISVTAVSYSG